MDGTFVEALAPFI